MTDDTHADRQQRLLRIVAEAVVRPSFRRCCEHGDYFFDAFYASLANHVPGVGTMFADTDMQKQNALIRDGIELLIDYAIGQSAAEHELRRLGELHGRTQLDVPPAMYGGWADALLETIAQHDPETTNHADEAWREVLVPGIELMASLY